MSVEKIEPVSDSKTPSIALQIALEKLAKPPVAPATSRPTVAQTANQILFDTPEQLQEAAAKGDVQAKMILAQEAATQAALNPHPPVSTSGGHALDTVA